MMRKRIPVLLAGLALVSATLYLFWQIFLAGTPAPKISWDDLRAMEPREMVATLLYGAIVLICLYAGLRLRTRRMPALDRATEALGAGLCRLLGRCVRR